MRSIQIGSMIGEILDHIIILIKLEMGCGRLIIIRSLQNQIRNEEDIKKKISLVSQQNVLLSYISGLSVAVNSRDQKLLQKIKSGSMGLGKS